MSEAKITNDTPIEYLYFKGIISRVNMIHLNNDGITSVGQLKDAIRSGKLQRIRSFGRVTVSKLEVIFANEDNNTEESANIQNVYDNLKEDQILIKNTEYVIVNNKGELECACIKGRIYSKDDLAKSLSIFYQNN